MKIKLLLVIIIFILQFLSNHNNVLAFNFKNRNNNNNNNSFKYFHYPHFNQYYSFSPSSSIFNSININSNNNNNCNNNIELFQFSNNSDSITIYDDYINIEYIDHCINDKSIHFESFSIKNQIPTFSNSRYSIKINNTFNFNDKIELISMNKFFNYETVSELNFKIYLPNKITNKIKIQFINSITGISSEKIPILYTINDFKGSPPYQQWLDCSLFLKSQNQPQDSNIYNGFKIITDSKLNDQNSWIDELYLDDFKLIKNKNNNQNITNINNQSSENNQLSNNNFYNRKILSIFENDENTNNDIVINKYLLKSSKEDILLGGNNGGHSFYSSYFKSEKKELYDEYKWEFDEDSGELIEYSNGKLILTGNIHGKDNFTDDCYSKWKINLEFFPLNSTSNFQQLYQQPIKSIKKELAYYAYKENGGQINTSEWKLYHPMIDEHSYWKGLECNQDKVYRFTGIHSNQPMQIGYGANGKNSNYGLSASLVLNHDILIEINLDLITNLLNPLKQHSNHYQQHNNNNQHINYHNNQDINNGCNTLKCPNGFKCQFNQFTGERKCVLNHYEYYEDDKDDCSTLECPEGFYCDFDNSTKIKSCLKNINDNNNNNKESNNINKFDCSILDCPSNHSCWYNSTDDTLNCKKYNDYEDPCYNVQCPENYNCVYEQSHRKCSPILSSKHTCKNVVCPDHHHCRIKSDGLPRCYPIIDPCKYHDCKDGKECRVTPCGEAKCFYPESCCQGKYCPPGYKCVKYNGIDECVGLPPPSVNVKTCHDVKCPINFKCIDLNKENGGEFIPFCIPYNGSSCQAYTTKYDLEGQVWIDRNGDGIKNSDEINDGMPGLFIRLLNNIDGSPARNNFGNIVPLSITSDKGYFSFRDIEPGSYVLFFGLVTDYHWTRLETSWANKDGFSVPFELPSYDPNDPRFLLNNNRPINSKYIIKKTIFPTPIIINDSNDYQQQKDNKLSIRLHNSHININNNNINNINNINNNNNQHNYQSITPLPEDLHGNPINVCPTHFLVNNILAGLVPNQEPPPPTPPPTLPPTPTPTHINNGLFAIGKRVFYDYNNNGVFDQNDRGVMGVKITLLNNDGSRAKDSKGNLVEPVFTDLNGYYFFDSLKEGTYKEHLENLPNSFYLSKYNRYPLTESTKISSSFKLQRKSNEIELTELGKYPRPIIAQYIKPDVNFALYSIDPLYAVGDTVYYDQNQNGKQDKNEIGIVGIQIKLLPQSGSNKSPLTTITDSDGHYSFDNVQGGSYVLSYQVPNGYVVTNSKFATLKSNGEYQTKPFDLNTNTAPLTGTRKPYKAITAARYDDTKDLPLYYPNSYGIGHVTFLDSNLDGIYSVGTDKPLPGVKVSIVHTNDPTSPVTNVLGQMVTPVTSDVNGLYYIDKLKSSTYTVHFDSPKGYKITRLPTNFASNPEMGSLANPKTSQTHPLPIEKVSKSTPPPYKNRGIIADKMFLGANAGYFVPPTFSIGYFVWNDLNYNGIYDNNEPPVPNVMVSIFDSNGKQVEDINGNIIQPVLTNQQGQYLISKVSEGSYYLVFSNLPNGYRLTDQRVLFDQSSSLDSAPNPETGFSSIFELSTSSHDVRQTYPQDNSPDFYINDHLNAGIVAGNQARPNIYAIGRYVYYDDNRNGQLDEGENGVEGIKVQLTSPNGQPALDFRGRAIPIVSTDSTGKYVIDNVPSGSYQIIFSNLPNTYNFENLPPPYPNYLTGKTGIFMLSPKSTVSTSKLVRKSQKYIVSLNEVQASSSDTVSQVGNAIDSIFKTSPNSNQVNANSNSSPGSGSNQISPSSIELSSDSISILNSSSNDGSISDSESLQEFPLSEYNPVLEATPGDFPLDSVKANRSDLTRNAAIVRSPTYAFGQLVFFIDRNGNTVGVPGVTVTLTNSHGLPVVNTNGKPLDPVTTDSKGQYRFNLLRAGTYHVTFTNLPAGFTYYNPVTGVIDFDLVNFNPDVRGALPADKVPRAVYYNPKINLQLTQPYTFAIGNQVWNDTNKDGLYQTTEPFISNVTVSLSDMSGNPVQDYFYQTVLPTVTDSNGEYYFDNLIEGDYMVKFEAPSRYYFTIQLVPFDSKKNPNSFNSDPNNQGYSGKVELYASKFLGPPPAKYRSIIKALAANFNIDAGLVYDINYVKSYAVGRYVFKDTNDNGIMDEGEIGIPGVKVDIYTPNGQPVMDYNGNIVSSTTTDENGLYLFDLLTSGTYVIKFSHIPDDLMFGNKTTPNPDTGITQPFSLFPGLDNIRLSKPSDNVKAQAINFNENAGLIDSVTFAVGHYLWFDLNSNGLRDPDEPPAIELTMVIYKCTLKDITIDCDVDYLNTTITDKDGFYYFDNLQSGIYKLYFWNSLKTYQTTIPFQGDGTNDSSAVNDVISNIRLNIYNSNITLTDTSLDPNIQAKYIDRNLNVGILKPSMFSLGYRVWYDTNRNGIMDPKESPVENVTVSLRHLKSNNQEYSFDIYGNPLQAITNASGIYWINNIIPGFYIAKFSNTPNDTRFTVLLNDNYADAFGLTRTISLFYNSSKVHPYNPFIDIGAENADYVNSKVNAGILKGKTDTYLYSVSGFVYYDDNKNGRRDPGEGGVNGTTVQLLDLNGNPMIDADSYQIQPFVTGPTGFYKFDDFLKGDYQISFNGVPNLGYQFYSPIDQQHLNISVLDNVTISLPENPNVVNATSADKVNAVYILRDQNCGVIKLITYAVGSRVIPNFYGTTLKDTGYNGAGVTVSLYHGNALATYANGSQIKPVLTDQNGFYVFDEVPIIEDYQVVFTYPPPGWMFEKYRNTNSPFLYVLTLDHFNLPRSRPIPINRTEYPNLQATYGVMDQNTYISPVLFGIGDNAFIDVDGSATQANPILPLPGVTVSLYYSNYKPAFDAFGNKVQPQVTDSQGNYRFMDLYVNQYLVHFSLVDGYSFTQPFSGDDPNIDSNINPSDGYSNIIQLDPNDPNLYMIPLASRNLTIVCDNTIDGGYLSLSPKGYISGMAYIDYNADFKFNSYDKPYPNITVSIYSGDVGKLVATTKTDKNGFYSFADLFISTQYQVVFSNIPKGFYALGDTVQFPVASKVGVNLNILYPTDYCQDNVKLYTSCFVKGDSNKDIPVAVGFPYSSYSDLNGDYGEKEEILTLSDTRTVYGIGYDRKEDFIYTSPYKKQFASISPQTASSIFRKSLTTGQLQVYVDLAKIYGSDFLAPQGRTIGDQLVYRILFGDLDIVKNHLWVTNLYRNIVVKIPLRKTPTIDNIKLINITHDCGVNGPFRIFGLGWDGKNMYVGGVCECSKSFDVNGLIGVVKMINDDEKTTTDILVIPLNYPRGRLQTRIMYLNDFDKTPIFSSVQNSSWVPWNDTGGNFKPQPQITDITFIGNGGNMVVLFKDRDADSQSVTPAGDMLLACKDPTTGKYVLESAGICGGLIGAYPVAIGSMLPQGPGGGEFFDDNFGNRDWQHDETSWGSAYYLPGSNELVGGSYDLFSTNEAVIKHWSLINGRVLGGFILIHGAGLDFVFNKVNGLGDIDSNCHLPTTYIGNYVWLDQNANGIQDPNEKGVQGVTVQLFDVKNGILVNSTQTNENGNYIFQIQPGIYYKVHFVLPPTYKYTKIVNTIEKSDYGSEELNEINSQADQNGDFYFTAENEGENTMDIDCGLIRG